MSKAKVAEGGGSIEINTTHEHYTDFEIDGVAFRRYGDLVFKDGDNVRLYAYKSSSGYYQVGLIKNFTRDFYVGPRPKNPANMNFEAKKIGIVKSIWEGLLIGAGGGFFIALVVAFIAWGFYYKSFGGWFKTIWLITTIATTILSVIVCSMPESETDKQKRERDKQQAQEQWAMYQNVINNDE